MTVPNNPNEMYMMVGEIRSDVKKLLEHSKDTDSRVSSLEKKWWTTAVAIGLMFPVTVARALGIHV